MSKSADTIKNDEVEKMKMILDIDTGVDDALAIAYALASKEADLIGIVGTYGNVMAYEAVQNTINLLELLGAQDVPVYEGEGAPLGYDDFEVFEVSRVIHGKDGIGNLFLENGLKKKERIDGVNYLIESAKQYQEELVIVATGPMTDLAAALEKEPEMKKFRGKIVIMGGALTVPGNATPLAEANISQDPKAAEVLFDSGLDITMVGLDVTLRTLLTKKETAVWRGIETNSGKAYAKMTDYYIDAYSVTSPHLHGCALHDPLAVAAAIHPDLVRTLSMYLKVGQGFEDVESGWTIGDERRLSTPDPNVKVCIDVDAERFLKMFMERLNELFRCH